MKPTQPGKSTTRSTKLPLAITAKDRQDPRKPGFDKKAFERRCEETTKAFLDNLNRGALMEE